MGFIFYFGLVLKVSLFLINFLGLIRLTSRSDFFGVDFFDFWIFTHFRALSKDSRMVWHLPIGHFLDELSMDEVCNSWTSSIDCACIVTRMGVCSISLESSLSTLQGGIVYFFIWTRIKGVYFSYELFGVDVFELLVLGSL